MYHSIDTRCADAYRRWTVPPAIFARHMALLADGGHVPITVSQLIALREEATLPPRTVVITFDDGLRDFLTGAMPILQRHGFAATLYVVSGCVGQASTWLASVGEGGRAMLGWDELRAIAASGIEIGGHTHRHPQLDVLAPAAAREEIRRCRIVLEDGIGQPVRSFAYPHGYASATTQRLVREAGFTSACRVRHALSSINENRFALSRIVMTADTSELDFKRFLEGRGLAVAPPRDRLVSTGWRLVRRVRHLAMSA
jgi:peptidoglycan/xylan/chitin deacetylase (PgdA/CDA1 family)